MKNLNQLLQYNKFRKIFKQNNFIIYVDNKILKLDSYYLNKKVYNNFNLVSNKLNSFLINKFIKISVNKLIYKLVFRNFLVTFLVFNKIKQTIKKFLIFKFLNVQVYNKFYFNFSVNNILSFNYYLNNKFIFKFLCIYIKFFFKTK